MTAVCISETPHGRRTAVLTIGMLLHGRWNGKNQEAGAKLQATYHSHRDEVQHMKSILCRWALKLCSTVLRIMRDIITYLLKVLPPLEVVHLKIRTNSIDYPLYYSF